MHNKFYALSAEESKQVEKMRQPIEVDTQQRNNTIIEITDNSGNKHNEQAENHKNKVEREEATRPQKQQQVYDPVIAISSVSILGNNDDVLKGEQVAKSAKRLVEASFGRTGDHTSQSQNIGENASQPPKTASQKKDDIEVLGTKKTHRIQTNNVKRNRSPDQSVGERDNQQSD